MTNKTPDTQNDHKKPAHFKEEQQGQHSPARQKQHGGVDLPDKSSGAGQQHAGNARPDQQGQGHNLKR